MGDLTNAYKRIIEMHKDYIGIADLIASMQDQIVVLVNKQSSATIACVGLIEKQGEDADLSKVFAQIDQWDANIVSIETNIARLRKDREKIHKIITDDFVRIRNDFIPAKKDKLKKRHSVAVKMWQKLDKKKELSVVEIEKEVKAAIKASNLGKYDVDGIQDLEKAVKDNSNHEKKRQNVSKAMKTLQEYVYLKMKKYDQLHAETTAIFDKLKKA